MKFLFPYLKFNRSHCKAHHVDPRRVKINANKSYISPAVVSLGPGSKQKNTHQTIPPLLAVICGTYPSSGTFWLDRDPSPQELFPPLWIWYINWQHTDKCFDKWAILWLTFCRNVYKRYHSGFLSLHWRNLASGQLFCNLVRVEFLEHARQRKKFWKNEWWP